MKLINQSGGSLNPNGDPAVQKKRMSAIIVVLMTLVLIVLFVDWSESSISIMFIPLFMIIALLILVMNRINPQKFSAAQNQPFQPYQPLQPNLGIQPIQPFQPMMNSSNSSPINPAMGNHSPEEARKIIVNFFDKLTKIIYIIFIPLIIIYVISLVLVFSRGLNPDITAYIIPIGIAIGLVMFTKYIIPSIKQTSLNYSIPFFPSSAQPNNDSPLSKQSFMESGRADNYSKNGIKIQQQCPFCGFTFFGKRDSCPKCQKII